MHKSIKTRTDVKNNSRTYAVIGICHYDIYKKKVHRIWAQINTMTSENSCQYANQNHSILQANSESLIHCNLSSYHFFPFFEMFINKAISGLLIVKPEKHSPVFFSAASEVLPTLLLKQVTLMCQVKLFFFLIFLNLFTISLQCHFPFSNHRIVLNCFVNCS